MAKIWMKVERATDMSEHIKVPYCAGESIEMTQARRRRLGLGLELISDGHFGMTTEQGLELNGEQVVVLTGEDAEKIDRVEEDGRIACLTSLVERLASALDQHVHREIGDAVEGADGDLGGTLSARIEYRTYRHLKLVREADAYLREIKS